MYDSDISERHLEEVHVHALHVFEFVRALCTEPEGVAGMDYQVGPDPSSLMTLDELSRLGTAYAPYPHLLLSYYPLVFPMTLHFIPLVLSHRSRCVLLTVILSFLSCAGSSSVVWSLVAYISCPSMHIPLRIYIGRLHIVLELISLVVAYHRVSACTPILVAPGVGSEQWIRGGMASLVERTRTFE